MPPSIREQRYSVKIYTNCLRLSILCLFLSCSDISVTVMQIV
jgi:hypothetical protein